MNKEQFLLLKIAEECTEIAQRALKTAQFGLDEVQNGQDKTNKSRLLEEIGDLLGVLDVFSDEIYPDHGDNLFHSYELTLSRAAKPNRIRKYMKLSQELGKVDEDLSDQELNTIFTSLNSFDVNSDQSDPFCTHE